MGALFLVAETYAVTGWIISGNATRTPVGPTPVPGFMKAVIDVWQIGAPPLLCVFVYYFLIRPWRREGRITSDGLFTLAFATVFWQDTLANWIGIYITYNSYWFNYGNWVNSLPGWVAPNVNQIGEPVIGVFPYYVFGIFGRVILVNWLMRKAQARWQLTPLKLVLWSTGLFIAFFAVFEPFMLRLGLYSYPSAIKGLTFNYGKYYQFPIYEALFWGTVNAAWACLRYFKDDKGHTLAERGVDDVQTSARAKTGLRFLALAGVCNAAFFFLYNVPLQFFVANGGPWPEDIVTRSYFTQGLCGEGTTYHCPGPAIPLNRPDSVHVGPDGGVVVPDGTTVPATPPLR